MSEKALLIAKEEMMRVIQMKKTNLSYEEASDLANRLLEVVECENPALMHKGIEWITEFYLEQLTNVNVNV